MSADPGADGNAREHDDGADTSGNGKAGKRRDSNDPLSFPPRA
jgi:hypothetical protein